MSLGVCVCSSFFVDSVVCRVAIGELEEVMFSVIHVCSKMWLSYS